MWLSGGPGVPSIKTALGQNGPCVVLEDSKTTEINPWSWNDKVNMIYIDQPVQVGYSYDALVNGTIDIVASPFYYKPSNFSQSGVPETNLTFLTGTFASQNPANAPNTTMAAAPFIWQFMQTWMQEYVSPIEHLSHFGHLRNCRFPEFNSTDNSFSIWGESYEGHWAPVFADYIEQQNDRIANGSLAGSAVQLRLDTVGLINACIDIDTQMIYYPEFAHNNTYGIEAITQEQYESAIAASSTCKNMTATCRSLAASKDPNGIGNQPEVNTACLNAFNYCFTKMHDDYKESGVSSLPTFTSWYSKQRTETLFRHHCPRGPSSFPSKICCWILE